MFIKLFGKKGQNKPANNPHGIDPDLGYCPLCKAEYRAGIVLCALCDVKLLSGRAKLAELEGAGARCKMVALDTIPEKELITIRKGPLQEIKTLKKMLVKEAIASLLVADEKSCRSGCCGGAQAYLKVRAEDAEDAAKLLALDYLKTTAVDLKDLIQAEAVVDCGAQEAACPACGCLFSPDLAACPDCGLSFG